MSVLSADRTRLFGYGLCGLGLAITLALLAQSFMNAGVRGWDAITYLAAGERLNAGHDLYGLSPGDRFVFLNPPYWTVPLLSPPPIAVIWRPLAALPNEWGIGVWWIACVASIAAVVGSLIRRLPLATGIGLLALAPSIAWELGVANVNGLLIGGIVATWLLARRGRDDLAGGLIGIMAAIKLWPIVLLAWFIVQRRWGAVRGLIVAVVIVGAISLAGAGLGAHLRFITIAQLTPPAEFSIAGMLEALGVSVPWLSYAILAFGLAEVMALRRRPELSFAIASATMVLGSPVVNVNTYAILIACLAPFAWPLSQASEPRVVDRLPSSGTEPARREPTGA
jgi:hypothetical protein